MVFCLVRTGINSSSMRVSTSSSGSPSRKQTSVRGSRLIDRSFADDRGIDTQELLQEKRVDGQPDRLRIGVFTRSHCRAQRALGLVEAVTV